MLPRLLLFSYHLALNHLYVLTEKARIFGTCDRLLDSLISFLVYGCNDVLDILALSPLVLHPLLLS